MKNILYLLIIITSGISSCKPSALIEKNDSIVGTWKLVSGLIIKGKDSVLTDYTHNQEMIKIITNTNFAFFRHDLSKGQEPNPIFVAGGGSCVIKDNNYFENLEYCNYREWENNSFEFTYYISGDTLITQGVETVEELKIDQFNIETYTRIN